MEKKSETNLAELIRAIAISMVVKGVHHFADIGIGVDEESHTVVFHAGQNLHALLVHEILEKGGNALLV